MEKLKYNWGIDGHERVLNFLEAELAAGNLAHAYLFAGPEKIGKHTVAKTLAHILQCPNNFCHECAICREIEKGYHSDTIELSDNGESVKIEEIREILTKLNLSRQSSYKILLVQNIERMTLESANAMLKTLEDPPENVIFILTTSRIKEILPTIISRVRVYNFRRLSNEDLAKVLQRLYPLADEEQIQTVSSFALGKPGTAIDFMRDPQLYDEYKKMYNDICQFVSKPDKANQFMYIAQLVKTKKENEDPAMIKDFLDVLTAVLRKKMLEKISGQTGQSGQGASAKDLEKIINLIIEAQRAQDLLKRNVNPKLLLENLLMQL